MSEQALLNLSNAKALEEFKFIGLPLGLKMQNFFLFTAPE